MIQKYWKPLTVGKLFNVPILLHPSGVIISALWVFLFENFYSTHNWPFILKIIGALLTPFIIFGSVTAHEFSHILTARKFGIPTRRIDLFIFGGCAIMEGEPNTAKEAFWVAFSGPLLSLWLYGISTGILSIFNFTDKSFFSEIFKLIQSINLVLFIFNMCFIVYPFDGGRIVHSIIWKLVGNKNKAHKISNNISKYILCLLVLLAISTLFLNVPFFGNGVSAFIHVMVFAIFGYLMLLASKSGRMPHV